jgi:hypothetical protein
MEIWKKVIGYENYEVSNFGNVKRIDGYVVYKNGVISLHKSRFLKQETCRKGKKGSYKRVTLSKNNNVKRFQVHRLVALHFIENPHNKPCVNHIDGNASNNKLSNLEWCTYSENEKHSYFKLDKITNGIKSRKIDLNKIYDIKTKYNNGITQKEIAKEYNVNQSTISLIVNEKSYVKYI